MTKATSAVFCSLSPKVHGSGYKVFTLYSHQHHHFVPVFFVTFQLRTRPSSIFKSAAGPVKAIKVGLQWIPFHVFSVGQKQYIWSCAFSTISSSVDSVSDSGYVIILVVTASKLPRTKIVYELLANLFSFLDAILPARQVHISPPLVSFPQFIFFCNKLLLPSELFNSTNQHLRPRRDILHVMLLALVAVYI